MDGGEAYGDCEGLNAGCIQWTPSGGHALTGKIEQAPISWR